MCKLLNTHFVDVIDLNFHQFSLTSLVVLESFEIKQQFLVMRIL